MAQSNILRSGEVGSPPPIWSGCYNKSHQFRSAGTQTWINDGFKTSEYAGDIWSLLWILVPACLCELPNGWSEPKGFSVGGLLWSYPPRYHDHNVRVRGIRERYFSCEYLAARSGLREGSNGPRTKLVDYLYDNHRERIDVGLFGVFRSCFPLVYDRTCEFRCGPTDGASASSSRATASVYILCYRGETEVRETWITQCINKDIMLQKSEFDVSRNE